MTSTASKRVRRSTSVGPCRTVPLDAPTAGSKMGKVVFSEPLLVWQTSFPIAIQFQKKSGLVDSCSNRY